MPEREYAVWDKKGEEGEDWIKYYYYSEAYRKSFLTLLEKQESGLDPVYHDEDILPVLMCFSQYLELAFKTLLTKAKVPLGTAGKGLTGHKPKGIYKQVKAVYSDFQLSAHAILLLDEFEWINEQGQSLRYPISSKGQRFWVDENEGRHFNLSGISSITKQVMSEIYLYFRNKVFGATYKETIETEPGGTKVFMTRVGGQIIYKRLLTEEEYRKLMESRDTSPSSL